jgi:hypothetical protein
MGATTPTQEDQMAGSKIWTVYGLAATTVAAIGARKALNATWKLSTGKTPPKNPEHPDVSMAEAVAWAALSGITVGLARMLASRKAAEYYRRSTGHLPSNLQDVDV